MCIKLRLEKPHGQQIVAMLYGIITVQLTSETRPDLERSPMEVPVLSWHWLEPVLLSCLLFLTVAASILRLVLRRVSHLQLGRMPTWLRWAMVLPSAFVVSYLAEVLPRLMFTLLEISINHHLLYRPGFDEATWQAFTPVFFVLGGAAIAPSRQTLTLCTLAAFKVVVAGINLVSVLRFTAGGGNWEEVDAFPGSPFWWNAIVYSAAIISILVLCILRVRLSASERASVGTAMTAEA